MGQGAGAARSECLVPQRAWGPTQCRQRPVAVGQVCADRQRELPVIKVETSVAARFEAQRRDGTSAGGRRLLSKIALWLGHDHESVETTQIYLHAHLALKEAALVKLKLYKRSKQTRFKPSDRLLAFLEAL